MLLSSLLVNHVVNINMDAKEARATADEFYSSIDDAQFYAILAHISNSAEEGNYKLIYEGKISERVLNRLRDRKFNIIQYFKTHKLMTTICW